MKRTRLITLACLTGLIALPQLPKTHAQSALTLAEAHAIAIDAYVYFYPLVSMDITASKARTWKRARNLPKGR
jgi:hypothetical protein